MDRKIVNLFLTIVLCIGIVLLGAGTMVRMYQMFHKEESVNAVVPENGEIHPVDDPALFAELCGRLDKALEEDGALHIYSILQAPEEYDIWECLSDISLIGEDALTDDEWLLYQKLRWCEECYEESCRLPDYSGMLSELTGVLNILPEVFYTWHFETKEDVEAYGEALRNIPELLDHFADRLAGQTQAGIIYPRNALERQIQNCAYQLTENSIFLEDYDRRIQFCDFLTEEEKAALIRENRNSVGKYVWEPYESVISLLEDMQSAEECHGLGYYPEGQEYYEYLLKVTTGSDKSAAEMYAYLEEKRKLIRSELLGKQADTAPESDLFSLSAEEIISFLYAHTTDVFPDFPQIDYKVETIPEEVNSSLYQAFFLKDDKNGTNYIYIGDAGDERTWMSLYQTLAHEALPGHMYCYNFPRTVIYPSLQAQIRCTGYSEGWALYAEFSAAEWLREKGLREAYLKQLYQKLYDEIVLCQIDIGIHVLNWGLEDIETFSVEAYGAGSREASEAIMEILTQNPGAYQVYIIGYCEVEELRAKYCTGKGMSERKFIEAYMRCGQAPFRIVDAYMDRVFGAQAYEMP